MCLVTNEHEIVIIYQKWLASHISYLYDQKECCQCTKVFAIATILLYIYN